MPHEQIHYGLALFSLPLAAVWLVCRYHIYPVGMWLIGGPSWLWRSRAIACLLASTVGLAACGAPPGYEPEQLDARPSTTTAQPTTSTRTLPPPTATSRPPTLTTRPPIIRTVRAVPDLVDPLACDPADPPERPEVLAEVYSPDFRTDTLAV